ncbi:MAG: HEAT repeat domain-containing protein [bacterium]|nr:HEAT repeat domain-containing protein [bacterium]
MTLLDDRGMQQYLTDGYVTVQTDFSPEFHRWIRDQADEIFETDGNPQNDIFPRIPELGRVWMHPNVRGVLTSILGPEYIMHPHRHCHLTRPFKAAQNNHKDSYEDDENVRHHRSRWAMALYYPQDVTEEMGPSAVTPGSQYYREKESVDGLEEVLLCGPAGTVTVVHYDLWHRATENQTDEKRFMMKFLFCRMAEPQRPSWQANGGPEEGFGRHEKICPHLWQWYAGGTGSGNDRIDSGRVLDLTQIFREGSEPERLDAAYALGAVGAVEALMEALFEEARANRDENLKRKHTNVSQLDAGYGLSTAGVAAVPALVDALGDPDWWVRAAVVDILGDIGLPAQTAVPDITNALNDASAWVRRNAIEALGTMGVRAKSAVSALAGALQDDDVRVRHNAALALAKMGADALNAVPELEVATKDENRYVRGLSRIALDRVRS